MIPSDEVLLKYWFKNVVNVVNQDMDIEAEEDVDLDVDLDVGLDVDLDVDVGVAALLRTYPIMLQCLSRLEVV